MPPPSRIASASLPPVAVHRVAGLDERRLDLRDRPVRVPLLQQRRGAGDVRARHARAARVPPRPPWPAGSDERIADARRATSGFTAARPGVGPADEKSAITPSSVDRGDGDRAGALPGERDRAVAEVVEVVPGRDHRNDPCGCGAVDRRDDDVARRLDLRLAEREVDHVHPVGDGGLDRGRDLGALPSRPKSGVGIVSAL